MRAAIVILSATVACAPAEIRDLDGRAVDPWQQRGAPFTLFVFLRTDCPISGRYAPELARLYDAWAPRGVRFELIYPEGRDDVAKIRKNAESFALKGRVLRDPKHLLVRRTGVTVTPEVALYDEDRRLYYRGRIDDRFPSIQDMQQPVSRRDLEDALAAAFAGTTTGTTTAVGCAIRGAG
jgi:hypothetical protein